MNQRPKPLVLCILDGWGDAPAWGGNAIAIADTPNMDYFMLNYPHTLLAASGPAVGLLVGETMGNSEVGHLTIGAGRIILQSYSQIHLAIQDGSFYKNQKFNDAIDHCKKNNSSLHLMGLLSDAGVHSHIDQFYALLTLCKMKNFKRVFVHAFTDGRDTGPLTGITYINRADSKMKELGVGMFASVAGRYWAMDRDNHWDRTEAAYKAIVAGEGEKALSAQQAVANAYAANITDEFIKPSVITDAQYIPVGLVKDNDAIIFWNFRPDRARQLTKMFVSKRKSKTFIKNLKFVTMTEYEKGLPVEVAFPPEGAKMPLARVISDNNLTQFHIAETEKYAHITYFLNGLVEEPFLKEDRLLVPSPKVATYDLRPEMSAEKITKETLKRLEKYDVVFVNYANPDMVGHTGNLDATKKAVETVDAQVGEIAQAVLDLNGILIITADHGNAEEKINPITGAISTEHTSNPVPFIIISKNLIKLREQMTEEIQGFKFQTATLADIAPTMLDLLNIQQPPEMTGFSLIAH
jgi:2,3-bisphosphoglycerate-independent phosphoglycerate mutase